MSNLTIVTSDNPRTEDPSVILKQIKAGITPLGIREYQLYELSAGFVEKGFIMVENRHEAIQLAIRSSRPGDIVLLAGKGHEDYQIIGTTKHHFDDREEATAAFMEKVA
jgi:UDP-N-acetylmuramoyl-L-alanyl-D-glutamate--2,6-diaminopimelate ligase